MSFHGSPTHSCGLGEQDKICIQLIPSAVHRFSRIMNESVMGFIRVRRTRKTELSRVRYRHLSWLQATTRLTMRERRSSSPIATFKCDHLWPSCRSKTTTTDPDVAGCYQWAGILSHLRCGIGNLQVYDYRRAWYSLYDGSEMRSRARFTFASKLRFTTSFQNLSLVITIFITFIL